MGTIYSWCLLRSKNHEGKKKVGFKPTILQCDFEISIYTSFEKVFPGFVGKNGKEVKLIIVNCLFHFGQCHYSKIVELGFKSR